jgi:hypothetical protein
VLSAVEAWNRRIQGCHGHFWVNGNLIFNEELDKKIQTTDRENAQLEVAGCLKYEEHSHSTKETGCNHRINCSPQRSYLFARTIRNLRESLKKILGYWGRVQSLRQHERSSCVCSLSLT